MRRWGRRLAVAAAVLVLLTVGCAGALLSILKEPKTVPGTSRDTAQIDDTHVVSYLRAGDPNAPRIIFIHGSPGSAAAWSNYLTDPMPGFEGVAVDRFGFGKSVPNRPVSSLKEQALAIEPLLVRRHGKWPILVGHSLGGAVACETAVDYPDKVGGLVILAGALSSAMETIHWYQRVADFWIVPSILPADLTTSNRELLPLKGELEALEPRLSEIRCPVSIIHGARDMLVPVANVEFMKKKFPKGCVSEVLILPKENHFLPWTIERIVRDSIRKIAAAGALYVS